MKYESHDPAQPEWVERALRGQDVIECCVSLERGGSLTPSYYIAQLCYPIAEIDWPALKVDE
jgi:hypothetical protein